MTTTTSTDKNESPQDVVEASVEQLMANPEINNPMIPDVVESTIYTYAIKGVVLGVKLTLGWLATRVAMGYMGPFVGGLASQWMRLK